MDVMDNYQASKEKRIETKIDNPLLFARPEFFCFLRLCSQVYLGNVSIQDVGKLSRFLTPTPLRRQIFTTIRRQI